jgi:hypothetical protein
VTPSAQQTALLRLVSSIVVMALLGALIQQLPFGPTTRFGILAWLLVCAALYWLLAGLGIHALLILQLLFFSMAAAGLSAKALLVWLGIRRLGALREMAIGLVFLGAACTAGNLLSLLLALLPRRPPPPPTG